MKGDSAHEGGHFKGKALLGAYSHIPNEVILAKSVKYNK